MSVPTSRSAAAFLAEAAAVDARVARAASPAPSGFLTTLGCAGAGFFLVQPVADGDPAVLATALDGSLLPTTVTALEKAGYVEVRKGYVGKGYVGKRPGPGCG